MSLPDMNRCQFCAEMSPPEDWYMNRCPKCGQQYDIFMAQDEEE